MRYKTIEEVISAFDRLDLKSKDYLYSKHAGIIPPIIADDFAQKICMCLALEIPDTEICSLLGITQDIINGKVNDTIQILNERIPAINFLNISDERKKLQYHLTACKLRSCKISVLDFPSINKELLPNYCYFHSISHTLYGLLQDADWLAKEFDQKKLIKSFLDEQNNFKEQLATLLQSSSYNNLILKSIYYPQPSSRYSYYSFPSNISIEANLILGQIRFFYIDKLKSYHEMICNEHGGSFDFAGLISDENTIAKIDFSHIEFNGELFFENSNCKATFSGCKLNNKSRIFNSWYPVDRPLEIFFENYCEIRNYFYVSANTLKIKNATICAKDVYLDVPYDKLEAINLPHNAYLFEGSSSIRLRDRGQDYFPFSQEDPTKQGCLQHVDLSNVVFDTANNMDGLSKLKFIDCRFNPDHKLSEDPNKPKLLKNLWRKLTSKYNYIFTSNMSVRPKLEADYRYLRKFYDAKGEYISGNDFHYNYMEQKRHNTDDPIDGLFLLFYKLINGYNTKPARGILWLSLMPIFFLLLFSYQYDIDIKISATTYKNIADFNIGDQINYLVGYVYVNILPLNILQQNDLFKVNDIKTYFLTSSEHLVSLIIIPLTAIAAYNRFRRSKSDNDEKSKESSSNT